LREPKQVGEGVQKRVSHLPPLIEKGVRLKYADGRKLLYEKKEKKYEDGTVSLTSSPSNLVEGTATVDSFWRHEKKGGKLLLLVRTTSTAVFQKEGKGKMVRGGESGRGGGGYRARIWKAS